MSPPRTDVPAVPGEAFWDAIEWVWQAHARYYESLCEVLCPQLPDYLARELRAAVDEIAAWFAEPT